MAKPFREWMRGDIHYDIHVKEVYKNISISFKNWWLFRCGFKKGCGYDENGSASMHFGFWRLPGIKTRVFIGFNATNSPRNLMEERKHYNELKWRISSLDILFIRWIDNF